MSERNAGNAGPWSDGAPLPGESLLVPLRALLGLAALATAGVALWILWVTMAVLPAHDPAHIPMWQVIAVGFLGYSALSGACVAGRSTPLRWLLGFASLGAVGLGVYGILDMLHRAQIGADTEGYIVLMGIVLAGHGVIGLVYFVLSSRPRLAAPAA
jgi:hypothetical protein